MAVEEVFQLFFELFKLMLLVDELLAFLFQFFNFRNKRVCVIHSSFPTPCCCSFVPFSSYSSPLLLFRR